MLRTAIQNRLTSYIFRAGGAKNVACKGIIAAGGGNDAFTSHWCVTSVK